MKNKGFTLIELLIVIGIIGIFASIVLVNLAASRARARDANRRETLKQLQIALQLYFTEYGSYPSTGGSWYSSESGNAVSNNGGNYIPGLAPTYVSALPRDPQGGDSKMLPTCLGWKSAYLYNSDGSDYKLLSHCAPESPYSATDPLVDPFRSPPGGYAFHAWAVCSTPAICASW